MRLLVIAERADYRLLVRKHVEIEWPNATLVEHRLGEDAPLEAQFAATGFDAVIIVGVPSNTTAETLAAGLLSKPEFAPIVLITLQDAPTPQPAAVPGLHRLYGRKIDRDRLLRAITAASREHRQSLSVLRAQPDFDQRYRFGSVMIRGHRCIRQVGSGGMCTIYLAESERAGTLVVLKVFNQVPDVSERIVGFDRFLQEYEIVAGLKHQNIVRIYDLGVADDHAYIAMEHFPSGDLRQRMKTPLSPATALEYLEQIASALRRHPLGRGAASGPEAGQRDAARRWLAVPDRLRPQLQPGDGSAGGERRNGRVSCGGMALLNPGDEVILFEPFYGYHVTTLKSLRVKPVFVRAAEPDFASIWMRSGRRLRRRRGRSLINTPANPSGEDVFPVPS